MNSAIFEGQLRHRRLKPRPHAFSYRMFMMYLDLDELDEVFDGRWLWSTSGTALARFRREHHMGDASVPLDESVRGLVAEQTGQRPVGPVRLLTHLSYFGYCFNPVSFYYCYDERGEVLETIVAEVNNTPWGEQHCYVLAANTDLGTGAHKQFSPEKMMHVSPFMPMEIDYDWRFNDPEDRLAVYMANAHEGEKIFDATMSLERTEISGAALARVLVMYPLMTLKVIWSIHWQALRLWLKRVPVYDHPAKHEPLEGKH